MQGPYTPNGLELVYTGEFNGDARSDDIIDITVKANKNTRELDKFATDTEILDRQTKILENRGHLVSYFNGGSSLASNDEMFGIPNTHLFGTYVSKGGPFDPVSETYYCQGACNVVQYWRTIPLVRYLSDGELVVHNGQWYYTSKGDFYQVDFIYPNNYLSRDLGSDRGWPAGPFSPHGIGIDYVPIDDACVPVPQFEAPAYGDNLIITDIISQP